MNEDDTLYFNFDYDDWVLVRIIREYYPHIEDKKVLSILACIAWTMKDFNWHVALSEEVQTRMTENPSSGEPDGDELVNAGPSENLLPLNEYNDILSHLIGTKILQQKIIPTKVGSPPGERLENDEYLVFSNDDLTDEILRNSEIFDLAIQDVLSNYLGQRGNYKKLPKKDLYILIVILVTAYLTSYPMDSDWSTFL